MIYPTTFTNNNGYHARGEGVAILQVHHNKVKINIRAFLDKLNARGFPSLEFLIMPGDFSRRGAAGGARWRRMAGTWITLRGSSQHADVGFACPPHGVVALIAVEIDVAGTCLENLEILAVAALAGLLLDLALDLFRLLFLPGA